jgi:Sulfotransferase family
LIDIIYIAGAGRSGSTIIENRIATMLGVPAVGETVYLWHHGVVDDQRCGCGEPFSECPFWTAVMQQGNLQDHSEVLQRFWDDRLHGLRAIPRILLLGRRDKTFTEIARAYAALFSALAAVSGSTMLIDSSKEPGFWLFLRLVPGIRVKTVHVVRDSRAVAFSWRRLVVKPELVTQRIEHMGLIPSWKTAIKWNTVNLIFSVARGRPHRNSYASIRYEDFAANPDQALAEVLKKLDLNSPVTTASGVAGGSTLQRSTLQHSVSGNPVRFEESRLSKIKVDDEWKRSMPRMMRTVVTMLSFPLLVAYGYLPARSES